jgi:hypothetical protein
VVRANRVRASKVRASKVAVSKVAAMAVTSRAEHRTAAGETPLVAISGRILKGVLITVTFPW